jgi:type IV pilus biogenesis/stability protein PilW
MVWYLRFFVVFTVGILVTLTGCSSGKDSPAKQKARLHYQLGVSSLSDNNPSQALQELLQAEAIDSDDAEIQSALAQAYLQKRAYELAEQHYLRAISLSGGAPQHYNNLGALYLTMERFDDAITAFRKAADNLLFPAPEVAWGGIGYAYFLKRDYPAAERAYRKARELNPRYFQAALKLGELYYGQERNAEALELFVKATELAPRSAAAQYWLGLTQLKLKNPAAARKAFEETVRLAPDSEPGRLSKNYLKTLH